MIILGVDPGITGAVAAYDSESRLLLWIEDMPALEVKAGKGIKRRISPEILCHTIRQYDVAAVAYIEKVGAMPGQGVSSTFNFGQSFGMALGVLAGLGFSTHQITPQKWKKLAGAGVGKGAGRMRAAALFPESADLFARVKDDGRADAALIAYAGAVALGAA